MALALSGVTVMADGVDAYQVFDYVLFEDVGDEAHLAMRDQPPAIRGNDTGGLLAAVLQRVETEVNHVGGFRMSVDSHHRAFVVELIRHGRYPIDLGLESLFRVSG